MKAAQYAKYFIRIILAICAIAILFTIVNVITPKIDVFSCVGVHWTAEHPQEVTCTFHPDFFAEKVLELKPKADIQDVENLAKSIRVRVNVIAPPEEEYSSDRIYFRLSLVQYDKRLQRKIGIKFFETVRDGSF